ncbi:unnamed protein product [Adineta steineri]|uniref:F-box domain-containing protein n=1 Tax=Adineta steineri TaxID=433720 RepID=A0A813S8V3_9BILA|nr:unnamed protein product [Adineta steineri]
MIWSLHMLPTEIVHCIIDKLCEEDIVLSLYNVCKRFNIIIDVYPRYQTITSLSISNNQIGSEGAQHLAKILEKNTTLISIYISNEKIGAEGTIYLAKALEKNTTLTTLFIEEDNVGTQGAYHLAQALRKNTTLTHLSLEENKIATTVTLVDIISGTDVFTNTCLSNEQMFKSLFYSSQMLIVGLTNGSCDLWNLKTGEKVHTLNICDKISITTITHNHGMFFFGTDDGSVHSYVFVSRLQLSI